MSVSWNGETWASPEDSTPWELQIQAAVWSVQAHIPSLFVQTPEFIQEWQLSPQPGPTCHILGEPSTDSTPEPCNQGSITCCCYSHMVYWNRREFTRMLMPAGRKVWQNKCLGSLYILHTTSSVFFEIFLIPTLSTKFKRISRLETFGDQSEILLGILVAINSVSLTQQMPSPHPYTLVLWCGQR